MKIVKLMMLISLLFACKQVTQEEDKTSDNATEQLIFGKVQKLTGDFKFTEGPAADQDGNVYFTDIPEQKIWIWTTAQELKIYRENTGGANGLFFDAKQNLLACEGYRGQISSTKPNGEYSILAATFMGVRFNQPNDIWPDGKGGVYFTDPEYNETPSLPQKGMHVYYIQPENGEIIRVCEDLVKPNGLMGTTDGKTLYITDHGDDKTYSYTINKEGTLTNKSLFANVGGDGMTIDKDGHIYLTTTNKKAIDVFSPQGKLIATIDFPEQPSNVAFGGKNNDELFVTARTSLYKVKTNTYGIQ